MREWQPIETAPKDGSRVLVAWVDRGNGEWHQRCVWWGKKFDISGYDESNELTLWRSEWTDGCVESFGYEEVRAYEPTHWMPLPAPPIEDEEACR